MLKIGKCYHIKFLPKKDGSCEESLIQVVNISTSEYGIIHLACSKSQLGVTGFGSFMTPKTIGALKNRIYEVTDIKNLPLYIGWKYTSPELHELIKQGTWEISPITENLIQVLRFFSK